jgi:ABC-type antimicrobial peptide transport system permease subunit
MTTFLRWTCRLWQSPWPQAEMAVRTTNDPIMLTRSIEDVFSSVERDLPMANVRTMTQIVDSRLAGERFSTALYGSFATLALLLAAIGIYGVLAFAVAQRTREIGLRLALGAGRERVLRMILREGIASAVFALGLGAVGACLIGQLLKSMLYGVAAIDARFAFRWPHTMPGLGPQAALKVPFTFQVDHLGGNAYDFQRTSTIVYGHPAGHPDLFLLSSKPEVNSAGNDKSFISGPCHTQGQNRASGNDSL